MLVAVDETSPAYALGRATPGPVLLVVSGVLAIIAWRRRSRVEAGPAAWQTGPGPGSGAATRLWAWAGVCALLGAVLTLSAVRWLVGWYDDDQLDSRSLRIGSTVAGLDRVEPSPAEAVQIDAQLSRMRAVGIDDPQLVILGSPTPAGQQMRLVVGKLASDDPDRAARDAIAGALSTVGEVDPSRISGHPAGPWGGAVACSTARGWGVCAWADHATLGIVYLSAGSVEETANILLRIRSDVEQLSSGND
jgi:hypothetical protein